MKGRLPQRTVRTSGSCEECGKWSFLTRADAKRFARTWHYDTRAYPCPVSQYFHLGHLAERIRSGDEPEGRDVYRRKNSGGTVDNPDTSGL